LARADSLRRENNLKSLKSAVLLVPGNAEYHALLAEHMEAAGLNPDHELELATVLSPRESRYWIRRGFRAEVEQKYAESEQYLIKAREMDNGFDPRSALMNYYFRRQNWPKFWNTARASLDMAYGDFSPIFRLCFAASDDLAQTRAILPPGHHSRLELLAFLLRSKRLEAAATVAPEVAQEATAEEVPLLLGFVEQQSGKDDQAALVVWNAMCARRLIPFAALSPDNGGIVTNGDFAAALHLGFDWRFGSASGAAINPSYSGGISVDLNGKQPESLVLLEQRIPVSAGKSYSIGYEYQLDGPAADSGLRWIVKKGVADPPADEEPLAVSTTLEGAAWHTGRLTLTADHSGSDRLRLEYRRAPATVRWNGSFQLRRVTAAVEAK
jgi:hypothetical protein